MADAGQLHLIREPLTSTKFLEEACALAASRARAKNISSCGILDQELASTGDEAFLHELF